MVNNFNLLDNQWEEMYIELSGESERACAIVGLAYIDDLLGQILEAYLVENKDASFDFISSKNPGAVLQSLHKKITTAYAIGLIDDKYMKALKRMNTIRNKFAHNLSISFEDEDITSLCFILRNLIPTTSDRIVEDIITSRVIFQSRIAYITGGLKMLLKLIQDHNLSGGFRSKLKT